MGHGDLQGPRFRLSGWSWSGKHLLDGYNDRRKKSMVEEEVGKNIWEEGLICRDNCWPGN